MHKGAPNFVQFVEQASKNALHWLENVTVSEKSLQAAHE